MKRLKEHLKSIPKDTQNELSGAGLLLGLALFIFVCRVQNYKTLKDVLFSFSKVVSEACFIYFVFSIFLRIINLIRKRSTKPCKHTILLWIIALILALPHIPHVFSYGTTQIGSYYEKSEYTARYYVRMSRKPSSDTDRKEYYLPATIHRAEDYYGTQTAYTFYGDITEHETYKTNYHIERLDFPNGGYLVFPEDDFNNLVIPGEEVKLTDYHDDTYYITLTTRLCYK